MGLDIESRSALPPRYYLENFGAFLNFVEKHHAQVLNESEQQFLRDFRTLPDAAQCLYVRLVSRKGPCFRDDRLNYTEIPEISQQTKVLDRAGFLLIDPPLTIRQLCDLLHLPEIRFLFPDSAIPGRRKTEIVDALETVWGEEARKPGDWAQDLPFQVLLPDRLETLPVFRLLFFGNLHQDFTEFVLQDLGMYRYEEYDLTPEYSLFREREALETQLLLHELAQQAREIHEDRNYAAYAELIPLLPPPPGSFALRGKYDRLANHIARDLERAGDQVGALQLYERTMRPPSRERRVRILAGRGEKTAALHLLQLIRESPANEEELEFALFFRPRLDPECPHPGKFHPREETLCLIPGNASVEETVLEHLDSVGGHGAYVENLLFLALFGLYFWDIIYAPRPGVFFHPFQAGPADLFTPDFYPARQEVIETRLQKIAENRIPKKQILTRYASKFGINNPFVHWQGVGKDLLSQALDHIPGVHLAHIFRRLVRDLHANRSGFPDLILFPPVAEPYRLVEVKAPGDRVQANQLRWMKMFQETGIPCQVTHVEWKTE